MLDDLDVRDLLILPVTRKQECAYIDVRLAMPIRRPGKGAFPAGDAHSGRTSPLREARSAADAIKARAPGVFVLGILTNPNLAHAAVQLAFAALIDCLLSILGSQE